MFAASTYSTNYFIPYCIVNVAYFLSAFGLFFWINNYVIPIEQSFLREKFGDEYERYLKAVKKWMFF